MGKPIVMGRKTHQSIGCALPGRQNIVLTRDQAFESDDVSVAQDIDAAFASAGDVEEVMIIGGAEIYRLALPRADRIYITDVHMDAVGDTKFPALDRADWREIAREDHPAERGEPAFSFVTLER